MLVAKPAAAAGLAIGAIGATIGFLTATWALLVARGVSLEAVGTAAWFLCGAMVGTIGWAGGRTLLRRIWRHTRRRRSIATAAQQAMASPSTGRLLSAQLPSDLPGRLQRDQVLDDARRRFVGLQAAWDAGDIAALRGLTTPDMLEELLALLDARGQAPNRTDVVTLHAELLCIEEFGADYLASIEFSGWIRESVEQGAVPFRELWMLASPKDEANAWRLARQQALL